MTDIELTRLAAKAAGICLHENVRHDYGNWGRDTTCVDCGSDVYGFSWTPLADDGQALRLAVAIQPLAGCAVLCLSIGKDRTGCEFHFIDGPDAVANTRRAIVVAAANIALSQTAKKGE